MPSKDKKSKRSEPKDKKRSKIDSNRSVTIKDASHSTPNDKSLNLQDPKDRVDESNDSETDGVQGQGLGKVEQDYRLSSEDENESDDSCECADESDSEESNRKQGRCTKFLGQSK